MHDSIAFDTHRVQLESCNVESLLPDDQASHRTHSQPPILQLGIEVLREQRHRRRRKPRPLQ